MKVEIIAETLEWLPTQIDEYLISFDIIYQQTTT